MSVGYSGTPLIKKLGIKPGFVFWVKGEPPTYWNDLGTLPQDAKKVETLQDNLDFIHFFTADRTELAAQLPHFYKHLKPHGMVWISWPKKASKRPSTVTEDVIRELVLPSGWVDVKVCAVDSVWSGLKVVLRKELR